ncbi:amino acid ABC transporter permease [Tissierella sp. MSJ-40]|uniref:Amino acid ABC transporter permease n=1 Tax=Tissierella simiarum TaxID=2841534 RepID=A0ABS6E6G3_9FIRM|nr:amino acid ABC transporter permease [Tissierella simiarum]MBU5438010.1 amino acid ABC transporter permease [Tissierella simiarum]
MKFHIISNNLGFILAAALTTIKITIISFLLGLVLAVIIGTIRYEKPPKFLEVILNVYIEIFRGTPLLIQLFFIYYGLPTIGIKMSSFVAAIFGLALNSAAYMSEIIRAAMLSVDKGQREASYVLGYNRIQSLIYIIYPQAMRIAIPSLMNSFSSLLKESSLVSSLAITELTRSGQLIYTRTYRAFEIYLTLGVLYFCMTYSVSLISKKIEKKINNIYQN